MYIIYFNEVRTFQIQSFSADHKNAAGDANMQTQQGSSLEWLRHILILSWLTHTHPTERKFANNPVNAGFHK